jgi:protein TonB
VSAADKTLRRWRPALVVGIGLVLVTVLIWLAIKEFVVADKDKKKRVIQEISLVRPPPPPPPPPKRIEEPPKPEIPQKVDVPKPDQPPDKPVEAPPPDTGIPDGPAGGMATDLAVGTGSGIIGGGGGIGNRFAWYGALVKERIQEAVARDKKLREADYRIMVNVWINASGTVTQAELISSTGDTELDSALKVALRNLPPLREGAPGDMPQPIKLRITAR